MKRVWTVIYIEKTSVGRGLAASSSLITGGSRDMFASYDQEQALASVRHELLQENKQLVAIVPGGHTKNTYNNNKLTMPY